MISSHPTSASPRSHAHIGALARANAALAIALVPLVAALVLSFRDGGYFLRSWGVAALALLGVLVVAVLTTRGGIGGRPGALAAGGWALLAIWQGASAIWSYEPSASTTAMGLTLLYGAAFTLVLVASPGPRDLRRLLDAALAVAVVVSVAALGARLLPELISGDDRGRLATPISYWNNLALVFAFGFVLAIGIAGDPTRGRLGRGLAAASLPLFPLGVLFSESRGGLVVLVAGSLMVLILAPGRIETAWMLAVAGVVCLPLMAFASARDSLSTPNSPLDARTTDGGRVALVLLGAAALCALGSMAGPFLSRLVGPARRRRAVGTALIAGCALVAVGALATHPPADGPAAWADRQVEAFKRYDPRARDDATTVADKLVVSAGSGRWQNWSVAADEFTDSPLTGTGAGDYRFRWAAERDIDVSVRNAHSLYLETLGESGLIGLALLLLPPVAVAWAVAGALRRRVPAGLARDLVIASAAGATVLIHAAGDWAWQMPAVVIPAIVLGAAALTASRIDASPKPLSLGSRWAIAGAGLLAILVLAGPVAASGRLESARGHASSGDLESALTDAREAARLDPQNPEARVLMGNVLSDLGRTAEADAAFADAVTRSPHDASVYGAWATVLLSRGQTAAARLLVRRATALDPLDGRLAILRARTAS